MKEWFRTELFEWDVSVQDMVMIMMMYAELG